MKVLLQTFGCRANRYDSELVRELVLAAGGEITSEPEEADAAVFNSCAVTAAAEADVRKGVRAVARRNPAVRSVVIGCAADRSGGALRELPTVHEVQPGFDLGRVAETLGLELQAGLGTRLQSTERAVLRIQDGCDEHCTFCATTLARGTLRSRDLLAIVQEARVLGARHAEIVLTGIHIGHYGRDNGNTLGRLLSELVSSVPHVRFRLSSVEASEIDADLAALLRAGGGQVAPHLHAPLQSGSDRLLKMMGRHWYTAESYARAVEQLVKERPAFGLGADVITGFPGETSEDHRKTVELVARLPFTYLHVFRYSERAGTVALKLPGRVDARLSEERAAELRELAASAAAAYARRRAGGEADVILLEGGGRRRGMTGDYLTVPVADCALPRGARFRGTLSMKDAGLVVTPIS